jgi:hypothetical protein
MSLKKFLALTLLIHLVEAAASGFCFVVWAYWPRSMPMAVIGAIMLVFFSVIWVLTVLTEGD